MGGGPGLTRRSLVGAGALLALPLARAAELDRSPRPLAAVQAADLQGRRVQVPVAGRATIVNFWATWCPPCRAEMPLLQSLPDFYGDRLALQLVNFKEPLATVQKYVRDANWPPGQPLLFDSAGQAAAAWDVRRFPTTVGFDAQGRARWRVRGEYDWTSVEAAKLVEGLWS